MEMTNDSVIYEKTGEIAYGFLKTFLKEKKNDLKNSFIKHKVGFLPPGTNYEVLQKIKRTKAVKQLEFLIGSDHFTLPIVIVGLSMVSMPENKKAEVAVDSRNAIYHKHGLKGVHILNICTTGYMDKFIMFLAKLNVSRNMSKKELIDVYEKILEDWERLTIFVQKHHSTKHIFKICESKMIQNLPFFHMFAAYGALKIAGEVTKKLNKETKGYGYRVAQEPLNPEGSRVVWIFEKRIKLLDRS